MPYNMTPDQLKAYHAKRKNKQCDFNFGCEDYASDGTHKVWYEWSPKSAPAKHNIVFTNKNNLGNDFDYDVCDGCALTIDDSDDPDGTNIIHSNQRFAPETKSYEGKRGNSYSRVYKARTQKDVDRIVASVKRYSAMTPQQRDEEYIKNIVPKLRKSNMKTYGRYIIDEKGNYIGDKELAKKYGR